MIRNQQVANLLENIAELLEAGSENPFRVGAYRNAARQIASFPEDITVVWREGRLDDIPGVGESIAGKIDEFLRTGRLEYLERLRQDAEPGLATLLLVPGLGVKRAATIQAALHLSTVEELAAAARAHRLRELDGFGEKLEANLLREAQRLQSRTRRLPLGVALPVAEEVAQLLRLNPAVQRADPAGSIRRMRDTIGDVDVLVASRDALAAIDAFCNLPITTQVLARGEARASILTHGDFQVDVRVVSPDLYGSALQYFTGSKEHNIALREMAIQAGLKLNEYGVFESASGRRVAAATEEQVYRALGLPWIPPELRENRGEIEAARTGRLPSLVDQGDLRGDLHVHTDWSDGRDSLEAMTQAARARGYEYVAFTDHSRGLGIAHGLTVDRVQQQHAAIEALNRRLSPFRILHGAEVNVRRDGQLDYPDAVLSLFDVVIAAIHSGFDQPEELMTRRVLTALRNPYVDVLSHPSGRLLGRREPYAIDLAAVLREARERNVALEIDSQPERLDLDDVWARRALDAGVTLAIDSDAHASDQLAVTRYGVATARRGWVAPENVLNALPLGDLLQHLHPHSAAA